MRAVSCAAALLALATLLNAPAVPQSPPPRQDTDVPYAWKSVVIGGGGAVPGLVVHPKVPGLVYIRTDVGGCYRWDDGARRWVPLLDRHVGPEEPNLWGAESLAVDPSDATGNTLYAALGTYGAEWLKPGRGGVWKSTDRGATWTRTPLRTWIGSNWDQPYGERLAVDPLNGDVVYYASRGEGLFRSPDGGKTWQAVPGAPRGDTSSSERKVRGASGLFWVAIDAGAGEAGEGGPRRACRVYVGAKDAGVFRSDDGGETWAKVADDPGTRGRVDQAGNLYVTGPRGIFRFRRSGGGTQGGEEITPAAERGKPFRALAVSPADPDRIVAARHWSGFRNTLYRTRDGGKTWEKVAMRHRHATPWRPEDHVASSVFALAFDPSKPDALWYSDWYATWRTEDAWAAAETVWDDRVAGHEETVTLGALAAPPGGPFPLLSGLADVSGFAHADLDAPPTVKLRPDGMGNTAVTGLDFAEQRPRFAAFVCATAWEDPGGGAVSEDGGRTWTPFPTRPDPEAGGGRVAVSSDGASIVWATGGGSGGVFATTDRGATWVRGAGLPESSGPVHPSRRIFTRTDALAADRVRPGVFYAYHRSGRLYRSDDGGRTWGATGAANLPRPADDDPERITLRAAPGRAGAVWVALGDRGLWASADAGETFARVAGVDVARLLAWGKGATDGGPPAAYVYGARPGGGGDTAGRRYGFFRSLDMGRTWVALGDAAEPLHQENNVLAADRTVFGRLYLGTRGRGLFYGDIAPATEAKR